MRGGAESERVSHPAGALLQADRTPQHVKIQNTVD